MIAFKINNGYLSMIQTDTLIIIFTHVDGNIYTTTISNLQLSKSIVEGNIEFVDMNLKLIKENGLIPLIKVCSTDIINSLLKKTEILSIEFENFKNTMYDVVNINAIQHYESLELKSDILEFMPYETRTICTDGKIVFIGCSINVTFNKQMKNLICHTIKWQKGTEDVRFDWKNLPFTLKTIILNGDKLFDNFLEHIDNIEKFIPNIILYNVKLKSEQLDILMSKWPTVNLKNNDMMIRYKKLTFSDIDEC